MYYHDTIKSDLLLFFWPLPFRRFAVPQTRLKFAREISHFPFLISHFSFLISHFSPQVYSLSFRSVTSNNPDNARTLSYIYYILHIIYHGVYHLAEAWIKLALACIVLEPFYFIIITIIFIFLFHLFPYQITAWRSRVIKKTAQATHI